VPSDHGSTVRHHLAARWPCWTGGASYADFATKVGILGYRLARNHPLPDGNKRAALLAIIEFAERNGRRWKDLDDDNTVETMGARCRRNDERGRLRAVGGTATGAKRPRTGVPRARRRRHRRRGSPRAPRLSTDRHHRRQRKLLDSWCTLIEQAVTDVAAGSANRWVVAVHIPFAWSEPWADPRSPEAVYELSSNTVAGGAASTARAAILDGVTEVPSIAPLTSTGRVRSDNAPAEPVGCVLQARSRRAPDRVDAMSKFGG
jgi:hypothetical protein